MSTRWALHLSCTIAAMVVRRNKSWDQSVCPPASTAALPKLCRAPLLLVFSFVIKLEKQYQTFCQFGFVNSWLLCYMFSIAVWPVPKLCQSSHKIFCGNSSSFQRSLLLSWSKMEFDPSWFAPTMAWTVFMARDSVKERIWSAHLSSFINWT